MNKPAVTTPAPKPETPKGINTPSATPEPVKPPAMKLVMEFLKQTNIKLMLGTLGSQVKQIEDGSIIISKPTITAEYIK